MNFLIDECLHLSLVGLAQAHGHDATHVNWRGLSGTADHKLMPIVVDEPFTFVTNNTEDFLRLFAQEPAHAGLIVLLPNVKPDLQRELFAVVLEELGEAGDLFNKAMKVRFVGDGSTVIETECLDLSLPEGEP